MVIIEKENFSVSQICSSGQCFRLDPADETGKVYELTAGDRYLKIEVAEDQKKVRFYCTQEEFEQFWKTYFDLDTCYADYLSLIKDDEYLKRAAGFGSGIRILQQDLWEMIVTFILSQQSNIPRIKSMIQRISEWYGDKKAGGGQYTTTYMHLQKFADKTKKIAGTKEKIAKGTTIGDDGKALFKVHGGKLAVWVRKKD